MTILEKWNSMWFSYVHGHNLVYNTCWEDPRIDQEALDLTPEDRVMVITSAGCNTLDYALASPKNVYAVDMNYRQNALLELKMAAIRQLEFDEFFEMFGKGRLPGFERVYQNKLRRELSPKAQVYWDDHSYFFSERGRRDSFYYHGTSGLFAWLMNIYLNRRPNLRDGVNAMLSASSIEEQQEV